METITYYFRGQIERGAKYKWCDGYSAKGENGGTLYPWHTKAECRRAAKSQGKKAVFTEEK